MRRVVRDAGVLNILKVYPELICGIGKLIGPFIEKLYLKFHCLGDNLGRENIRVCRHADDVRLIWINKKGRDLNCDRINWCLLTLKAGIDFE